MTNGNINAVSLRRQVAPPSMCPTLSMDAGCWYIINSGQSFEIRFDGDMIFTVSISWMSTKHGNTIQRDLAGQYWGRLRIEHGRGEKSGSLMRITLPGEEKRQTEKYVQSGSIKVRWMHTGNARSGRQDDRTTERAQAGSSTMTPPTSISSKMSEYGRSQAGDAATLSISTSDLWWDPVRTFWRAGGLDS